MKNTPNSKNSALLDELLQIAKSIETSPSGNITAESFILAIINVVDGSCSLKCSESKTGLEAVISEACVDMSLSKMALEEHLAKNQSSLSDEAYFKIITNFAGKKAIDANNGILTPEILFKCIIDEPSIRVKALIKKQFVHYQPEAPAAPSVQGVSAQGRPEKTSCVFELADRVKKISDNLSGIVLGQEKAISVLTAGYFQGELSALTDAGRHRPHSTFLFAGPPGVGKTFLAESFAKELGIPFARYDMSEYCDDESVIEFSGSDKVYKNGKEGNFTSFVQKNPTSIVLFDEIEKAHLTIIHQFLQMLDAGRARDNFHDIEISLKNVIMIFTTNAGKQLYEDAENGNFSDVTRKVILDALQKDVNPLTEEPYFPAAICSRFASGNVVMFNHVSANSLLGIAKKEIAKHTSNFERAFGVATNIDENVYTALLLAEGGNADARIIRARSESFFSQEVFELFRLAGANNSNAQFDKISIDVVMPEDNPEIAELFESNERQNVLVFGAPGTLSEIASCATDANMICVSSIEEAKKVLHKEEISFAVLDFAYGSDGKSKYLNIEDEYSVSKELFAYMNTEYSDLPVYMLRSSARTYTPEEITSVLSSGIRGTVELRMPEFANEIADLCVGAHKQKSLRNLAKSNKIITYQTAQWVSENTRTAHICIIDLRLVTAISSLDSENIMSGVSKPNVKYKDVIGSEDAKKELEYFGGFLKNPRKFRNTGVKAPKGILLYGPPGTGKTMLAKAMAGETDVTFIAAEGNSFIKGTVGEGAEKVHEIFRIARKYAPSIIFVDEIDVIAKERTGYDKSADVLTAFLTEMDGFKQDSSKPVFVLAATNFDVEPGSPKSLDGAILRRFDRRIYVDLPNCAERVELMNMITSKNSTYSISNEKIQNLAVRSAGMSPASLESVFELALRNSIMSNSERVTDEILEDAFETFRSGEKKEWDSSLLRRTAIHESGHAFICAMDGEIPSYLTIVARSNHGGYMQFADNEGKAVYTREELRHIIRTALGGRAAEIVYFGEEDGISTGASGDLRQATSTAQAMVCTYGMDAQFGMSTVSINTLNDGEVHKSVRSIVNTILEQELAKAIEIISANKEKMDKLVEELVSKNRLSGEEISAIINS